MKSLKIGNVKILSPIFLAPMLDVTNLPYRLLCRKYGAGMTYTEMIHVEAILHENDKTKQMMASCSKDTPLGIQITSNSADNFKKVVPFVKKYDLVDLNCGCPSERIILSSAGSCLLSSPEKIEKMIKTLKKEGLVVTAKVRLGLKKNNILEIAKLVEKAGADAITVHARLASQGYSTPADWSWIKKVKETVSIPVIGNGDVDSGEKAKLMLELCDGAMVGRASIGNPLVFKQITNYLKTGKEKEITNKERLKSYLEYLKLAERYSSDVKKAKFIGCPFLKGFEGAAKARESLMSLHSIEEIKELVREIKI